MVAIMRYLNAGSALSWAVSSAAPDVSGVSARPNAGTRCSGTLKIAAASYVLSRLHRTLSAESRSGVTSTMAIGVGVLILDGDAGETRIIGWRVPC